METPIRLDTAAAARYLREKPGIPVEEKTLRNCRTAARIAVQPAGILAISPYSSEGWNADNRTRLLAQLSIGPVTEACASDSDVKCVDHLQDPKFMRRFNDGPRTVRQPDRRRYCLALPQARI